LSGRGTREMSSTPVERSVEHIKVLQNGAIFFHRCPFCPR